MIPLRYDSKDQLGTADDREIVNFELEFRLEKKFLLHTHHWKCQLGKKELSIPPIWDCLDLLGVHFFPMGKYQIQPFLRAGVTWAK